ncbi:MAG: hypothetical protein AABW51_00280 [Nanoarchaeota archaeon]
MSKIKTREITIVEEEGVFSFFKKSETTKQDYDFEGISTLRRLLSNEKARILHVIKYQKPNSIYELAKILKRNFKSVYEDLKLLERFGFIDFIEEKGTSRTRHKPEIIVDTITLHFKV